MNRTQGEELSRKGREKGDAAGVESWGRAAGWWLGWTVLSLDMASEGPSSLPFSMFHSCIRRCFPPRPVLALEIAGSREPWKLWMVPAPAASSQSTLSPCHIHEAGQTGMFHGRRWPWRMHVLWVLCGCRLTYICPQVRVSKRDMASLVSSRVRHPRATGAHARHDHRLHTAQRLRA